jgi:hypothetical protein
MKSKYPLLVAVFLNLVVWNYFISGSWGSYFSLGYFIGIHLAMSSVVVLLLSLLARRFLCSTKIPLLLLLSILVAYLPPAIIVWLTHAFPELLKLQFEDMSNLLFVAIITAATSWKFWAPLGIANYLLLRMYSKRVRDSGNTANKPIKPTQ